MRTDLGSLCPRWTQVSLDIFWLKESLEASDNLPDPDVIAQEIVDDLEAALEQFREIVGDLGSREAAENVKE
jgi:type I restriction enzyme M protein